MTVDPVPTAARTELERLARRWQQLPLDRALAAVPAVRALAQDFADDAAPTAQGDGRLPDLGPAVVMDQLVVTAYDLAQRGRGDDLAQRLAQLRREIG